MKKEIAFEASNPFFKAEDFQKLEISVEGTNTTSQIPFPKGAEALQLIQIVNDGVWIDIPPKSCAMGHNLALHFLIRTPREDHIQEDKIQVSGVIEQMEGDLKTRQQARVRFRQFSQKQWNDLLKYIATKQISVNDLIKKTRK